RDVEVHRVVLGVRLLLAQVPGDARAAQHHAGHAPGIGLLRGDHADADGTLLPDAVVGQQRLVLVDALGELAGEVLEVVQERTLAGLVEALELGALVPARLLVLRHPARQVAVHAAGTAVGPVPAPAAARLV